jgi:hypothetical protein
MKNTSPGKAIVLSNGFFVVIKCDAEKKEDYLCNLPLIFPSSGLSAMLTWLLNQEQEEQ